MIKLFCSIFVVKNIISINYNFYILVCNILNNYAVYSIIKDTILWI